MKSLKAICLLSASFLCAAAWAKAPLVPLYCYHFDRLDTVNDGIDGHDANCGSGTIPLTYKLWGSEKRVPYVAAGKWGGYSIQENAWSSFWLVGDATKGLGCSVNSGFTLSFWMRPPAKPEAWKDILGFRLGTEDVNFEYCDTSGEFQLWYADKNGKTSNILRKRDDLNTSAVAMPVLNDWNHVCLIWKPQMAWRPNNKTHGELWVNGKFAGVVLPSDRSYGPLAELHLGCWQRRNGGDRPSSSNTGIGEIALYDRAVSEDDVQWLFTHRPGPIPHGRETLLSMHMDPAWNEVLFDNNGTLTNVFRLANDGTFGYDLTKPGALGSLSGFYSRWWNGVYLEGDAAQGLGCSTKTGFTFSYWSRPTANVQVWGDLLSFGLGNGTCNVRHEFENQAGKYYFYGSCTVSNGPGGESFRRNESNNAWHHHVLVCHPGQNTCQHWLDGKKDGAITFTDTLGTGVFRRLCIGGAVLNENGGWRTAPPNASIDEVALYNFSFTDEQVAWLNQNAPKLPAFTDTALARTVSGDCQWDGFAADWLVPGTTRRMVWPAGEDGALTATLTAAADANVVVDTVVESAVVVKGENGAKAAVSVAKGCVFAPSSLTLAEGATLEIPAGTKVAKTITFGPGSKLCVNAAALAEKERTLLTNCTFVLPEGETDVLAHLAVTGVDGRCARLSEDGKTVLMGKVGMMLIVW